MNKRNFPSNKNSRTGSVDENRATSLEEKRQLIEAKRLRVVLIILAIPLFAMFAKLVDYDIVNVDRYTALANERRVVESTLYAKRGTIYDRTGNILATSVECHNVFLNPNAVEDDQAVIDAFEDILNIDPKETRKMLSQDTTFTYVRHKVDEVDCDKLRALHIVGIDFEPTVKRVYPYGNLCAQVLGVVGVDNQGLTGLELYYNDILSGVDGTFARELGRDGSYIAGGSYELLPAVDGTDIVLSIDANLQEIAETELKAAVERSESEYGSVCLIDPRNGEILAAASYPTFDPSDLSTAASADLNLRLVTDSYEPGSTFKPFTASIALDSGSMTDSTSIEVPPMLLVGDDEVTDVDKRDWRMDMDLREILRRSSNTGIALVGQSAGQDTFASYIDAFGFGTPMGIDFPGEISGFVTQRADYNGATVGAMSFGQAVSVPPIQIIRAMTAIANDGTMTTPHFLISAGENKANWSKLDVHVISESTADQVADYMQTVVDEGTGSAGHIDGYALSGKTGTAQIANDAGGYAEDAYFASFIGFGPTPEPCVMGYINLCGTLGTGGGFAAPAFGNIMSETLLDLGIYPSE